MCVVCTTLTKLYYHLLGVCAVEHRPEDALGDFILRYSAMLLPIEAKKK